MEEPPSFWESSTVETIVIVWLCVAALVGGAVAVAKGRSRLWAVGCVLFPPLFLVLFRLPSTKMAGKIRCPSCQFVNPIRRDTCARCKHTLDYTAFDV